LPKEEPLLLGYFLIHLEPAMEGLIPAIDHHSEIEKLPKIIEKCRAFTTIPPFILIEGVELND
jgi:hypothetical protein